MLKDYSNCIFFKKNVLILSITAQDVNLKPNLYMDKQKNVLKGLMHAGMSILASHFTINKSPLFAKKKRANKSPPCHDGDGLMMDTLHLQTRFGVKGARGCQLEITWPTLYNDACHITLCLLTRRHVKSRRQRQYARRRSQNWASERRWFDPMQVCLSFIFIPVPVCLGSDGPTAYKRNIDRDNTVLLIQILFRCTHI